MFHYWGQISFLHWIHSSATAEWGEGGKVSRGIMQYIQYKFSINVFVTVFVFLLVRSCLLILMKYLKGDNNLRLCMRQLKIKFLNLVMYGWFS